MSTAEGLRRTGLSQRERNVLHRLLLDAVHRARSDLHSAQSDFHTIVEASAQSNADDEHDPEGSTIAFERAQVRARMDRALAGQTAAEQALARWESGGYGSCEVCRGPIGYPRLRARPATTRCLRHVDR